MMGPIGWLLLVIVVVMALFLIIGYNGGYGMDRGPSGPADVRTQDENPSGPTWKG